MKIAAHKIRSVSWIKLQLAAVFICLNFSGFSQTYSVIVDGGYTHRLFFVTDSLSGNYEKYVRAKKPGKNFGVEAVAYNFGHGIGLKFSSFMNRVSGTEMRIDADNHVRKSESIRINYYSIQYHWLHLFTKLPMSYELCAGFGLLRYRSEGKEYDEKLLVLAKTYGMNAAFKFEYALLRNFSIGTSVNLLIGKMGEATRNGYSFFYVPNESLTSADINLFTRLSF